VCHLLTHGIGRLIRLKGETRDDYNIFDISFHFFSALKSVFKMWTLMAVENSVLPLKK